MASASIEAQIGRDHYKVLLQAGKNSIIADEPITSGGGEEGMNPYEILASALGACTCATVRMYADRKEMALEAMKVSITLTRDEEKNEANLVRTIDLIGALTETERDRLLQIANKCPVHKILTNPINITTSINP